MFCQIRLPTRHISMGLDLDKFDIIELGRNPDLESDERLFILLYEAGIEKPAVRISCEKLDVNETMVLLDWLMDCKGGDGYIDTFTLDMLKEE